LRIFFVPFYKTHLLFLTTFISYTYNCKCSKETIHMTFNNVFTKAIASCPPLCKPFNQFFFFLKICHSSWVDLFLIMWHLNHNKLKLKLSIKIKRTDCLIFYIFWVCDNSMYVCIWILNTSLGPLSFTFVSDKSFKFLIFQICPLSFEFVSDRSFKFLRFQIGPLSFEFVSDRSFKFLTDISTLP